MLKKATRSGIWVQVFLSLPGFCLDVSEDKDEGERVEGRQEWSLVDFLGLEGGKKGAGGLEGGVK